MTPAQRAALTLATIRGPKLTTIAIIDEALALTNWLNSLPAPVRPERGHFLPAIQAMTAHGIPPKMIAAYLGVPVTTVRVRLSQARRAAGAQRDPRGNPNFNRITPSVSP